VALQDDLVEVARGCVKTALAKGAQQAGANAYRVRDVTLEWRDGKVDKINEATTRGVALRLFVDGRYSTANSSDLRPEALARFIEDAVAMARSLEPDSHRSLPEPSLYAGRSTADLLLEDARYGELTALLRRSLAEEAESAARSVQGGDAILSVTSGFNDTRSENARVNSNGFEGRSVDTTFFPYATVTVRDADGRPEDSAFAGSRFLAELPKAAAVGREAAQRALRRRGSKKAESSRTVMVLDNRAAGRLAGMLGGPLSAQSLQQKRSFFEGKLGETVGSPLLAVADDPLLPKGFGSRHYDSEGIAARRLPIFEAGVLKGFYVDTYYGKKLGLAPTTGGTSNLSWAPGSKTRDQLVAEARDGFFVTGFIGGNSNGTTGDFSLGLRGFRIRAGQLAEPVSEMNISGNHLELWKRLVAVGNDPYPYSTLRTPTLVFEGVQFAGL
jgi:PmbA protein